MLAKMLIPSLVIVAAGVGLPLASAQGTYNVPCPLFGPDVPPPTSLSSDSAIATAKSALMSNLTAALRTNSDYSVNADTISFSLDIFDTQGSLFTYHHSAPGLAKPTEGVSTVDSNTIYRIGSCSKLWTVYLYLISIGETSLNDPITKYVPELAAYAAQHAADLTADDIDIFDWSEITIGSLMSHMSGAPVNAAPFPAQDAEIAQLTGLPPVSAQNISWCGDPNVVQLPCDRAGFFQDYLVRHPVAAPFYTPIYADATYQILGYAMENITKKSFEDLLNEYLLTPLHTNATSYTLPSSSDSSIIPFNASYSWYNASIGDEGPTGGIYSSINDMRRLGMSILNSSFLTPAQTRRWMKPVAFTSSAKMPQGAPWEITQAPGGRNSYIYGKAGGVGVYASEIAFLPDYRVGFTVLVAGGDSLNASTTSDILSDIIVSVMYPALEAAAKEEAVTNYVGTYSSAETNSSITVATDIYPGLHVTAWTFGGTDFFPLLAGLTGVGLGDGERTSVRLYPTGLTATTGGTVTKTGWRAVAEFLPFPLDTGAFSLDCSSWIAVDRYVYGINSFDEVVFNLGKNGQAVSMDARVLEQPALPKGKGNQKVVGRASRMIRS